MIKEIKENLSDLLGESTSYGLPRIFKTNKVILKIFWLTYFLIGGIATVVFVLNVIMSYLEYEIISRIQTISEQSMSFPAISICPTNSNSFNNKSLDQILEKCNFDGEDCLKNANNYFEKKTYHDGECIIFNNGKNMTGHSIPIRYQYVPATTKGFTISIGKLDAFYFIYDPLSIFYINDQYRGQWTNYALKVHLITKNAKNQNHRFVLSKTVENKFSTPNRPCFKDVNNFHLNKTIIDYIQSNNVAYKQEYCFELCGELDFIEANPCNQKNISSYSVKFNNESFQNDCAKNYLNFFKNQSLEQKCSKYFPLECDFTYYSAMISENSYSNSTETQIFYNEFKYTLFTETAKTSGMDLVSNIGGMLSLFIGLSFVSFFEFIEIVIELFFIFLQKNNQKCSNRSRNNKDLQQRISDLENENKKIKSKIDRIDQLEDEFNKFKSKQ